MRSQSYRAKLLVVLLAVGGLAPLATRATSSTIPVASPGDSPTEALLRRYIAAFNQHDVQATLACVDTAFRWYNVAGDSMKLVIAGRETQRSVLTRYFKAFPDVSSDNSGISVNGPWAMVRERIVWTGAKGRTESVTLAVYEVRDGQIKRVFYFPAESRSSSPEPSR
ncbi:MAG: nuclear transport factor 2 family protein [Candidatus Eisenbacteria bacterium]